MIPDKKAKELVDKFSNQCLLTIDGAKVAALIAVDELINYFYTQPIDKIYWLQVKQEIEKL